MEKSIEIQDYKKTKSLNDIYDSSKKREQKDNNNKTIICIVIIFLVLILLYVILIKTGILKTFLQDMQLFLQKTYKTSKIKVVLVVFSIMLCVVFFGLPAHMLFSIFSSLVIEDKLLAFFVLLIASVTGSLIIYIFCQWTCKDFLLKRFKDNKFYEVLKQESNQKPYQTSFLARLLFIPAGMKDYILALINNPFIPFMLSGIILHAFFCAESVLIAKEFTEIEEFMTNNKSWNEKSTLEKLSLIIVIFFIIFTLLFASYLGCWVTQKFQEKKQIEIDLETNIKDKTLMNEQLNQIINKMEVEDNKKQVEKKEEKKDKKETKEEELSEQDQALKDNIELMIQQIEQGNNQQKLQNLDQLFQLIINSRKTRTQIPKELKFLQPHYKKLKETFELSEQNDFQKNLADFLALICISLEENYDRNSLRFLEKGNGIESIDKWGQEFAINLAGDIGKDYNERYAQGQTNTFDDLYTLSDKLLPYMFKNGDTISAVDLLLDIERLDKIKDHIKEDNYRRIYDYLVSSVDYASDTVEFEAILNCLLELSLQQNQFVDALRVAIRKNDKEKIEWIYRNAKDRGTKIQLAFNLARNRIVLEETDPLLNEIISNMKLSHFYLQLVKDLNLMDPKRPREVYKEMLGEKGPKIESSQLNLADTFTNAFVNLGTSKDSLFDNKENDKPWIQKVEKKGIFSAVCSLGLIHMWNFEELSNIITDYFDLKDGYAKAGAYVAIGLSASGIHDENDPALAFLLEAVESEDNIMKLGAAIGFGFAYSGSNREELKDSISELIIDENLSIEVNSNAAISLSHIFVGELDQDVINTILSAMMVYSKETLDQPFARMLAVALGINFIGQQNHCEATLEALEAIEHPIAQISQIIIETCSYIGSGNVLIIQKYMQMAAKNYDPEKDQLEIEKVCVGLIAVSLVAISESVGRKMIIRNLHHILQYSELPVKRVVPILLAILGIHNFNIQVTDLLYKLAHNDDKEMAMRSIFALGLISAGTNNSRVGGLLKNLGIYYEEEKDYCFVVRIALGLLHSGKGLLTLNQYFSEGLLYNKTGFAGLVVIFYSMLNFEDFLVKNNHYLIYHLSLALYPKMMFTVDEELNNVPINIRVGTAIDTVTQVGMPRKITGFQTHTSPVVVNNDERAELGTEEYIASASDIKENIIVVKKNPDYKEEERS